MNWLVVAVGCVGQGGVGQRLGSGARNDLREHAGVGADRSGRQSVQFGDFAAALGDTVTVGAPGKPGTWKITVRGIGSVSGTDVDPLNATNFQTENLFGVFVTQALKGGEVVPYILQGGLGMPERE